jgi:hypothetical protein
MDSFNPPHYPRYFQETGLEHRHNPAKWCHATRKWTQDGRVLRNVKASKAFVWPKDGRNDSTWGRLKDIFQNKGPDMYLTTNAEKHDVMHNRPSRAEWTGWHQRDDEVWDSSSPFNSKKHAPWTSKGVLGGRMQGLPYDFRTRQYGAPHRRTWTNAVWQPEPRLNKYNPNPEALRDITGRWFQDGHYLPQDWWGPVHNERGRGFWGFTIGPERV